MRNEAIVALVRRMRWTLAAIAFMLLAGPAGPAGPAGAAEITACNKLDGMTSTEVFVQNNVTVINRTAADISLDWIDYQGNVSPYLDIPPGQRFSQLNQTGYLWRVHRDGKCLCGFKAEADDSIIIDSRGACTAGGASPSGEYEPAASYNKRVVAGFTVYVSSRFKLRDVESAIATLEDELRDMRRTMPPNAFGRIAKVSIWLEASRDDSRPLGQYYSVYGMEVDRTNLDMRGGVMLRASIDETAQNRSSIVHELAHAYHDMLPDGPNYAPIAAAYEAAKASGKYDSVATADGVRRKSYAIWNQGEYFAVLSEAYLRSNSFYYPFDGDDLAEFDPEGYAAVKEAWAMQ